MYNTAECMLTDAGLCSLYVGPISVDLTLLFKVFIMLHGAKDIRMLLEPMRQSCHLQGDEDIDF